MYILGISCFFHNSAVALIKDGKVVAAASEERFSREKNDANFPYKAIDYCLSKEKIRINKISHVVFYEKLILKFERILLSNISNWPKGLFRFSKMLNFWLSKNFRIQKILKKELGYEGNIFFTKQHESLSGTSFFTSNFKTAAILTIDNVGEWATTSISKGDYNKVSLLNEVRYPNSLGLLYSAFTYFLGFNVNEEEYKVMLLSAYGKPKYSDLIKKKLIKFHDDSSFTLNQKYFFYNNDNICMNKKFYDLFDLKRRDKNMIITQKHKDIAKSIQVVLEEAIINLANKAYELTREKNLCLAGNIMLNCIVNSRILKETKFEKLHIFPAAGYGGGSLGAALFTWNHILNKKRSYGQNSIYLGPSFKDKEIRDYLIRTKIPCKKYCEKKLIETVSDYLKNQKIIGWFQGPMEFGPISLGNRSIIADGTNKKNWDLICQKIKFEKRLVPFDIITLMSNKDKCFSLDIIPNCEVKKFKIDASVDSNTRFQAISKEYNLRFYNLLNEYKKLTGIPAIINTSFNISKKPIVCTPQDAFSVFLKTGIDILVLGTYVIDKRDIKWMKNM
ncbi:hypothetical protein ISS07_04500 [Candidatus Woesearchaeota archaeon]|nr:hypothetical protein [Candidatus Woesearchaeota archaeon]